MARFDDAIGDGERPMKGSSESSDRPAPRGLKVRGKALRREASVVRGRAGYVQQRDWPEYSGAAVFFRVFYMYLPSRDCREMRRHVLI